MCHRLGRLLVQKCREKRKNMVTKPEGVGKAIVSRLYNCSQDRARPKRFAYLLAERLHFYSIHGWEKITILRITIITGMEVFYASCGFATKITLRVLTFSREDLDILVGSPNFDYRT